MKITKIEAIPIAVPFYSPYVLSYTVASHPESVIVKMHTDSGQVGYGEAAAMPESHGSNLKVLVAEIREALAPSLIGADPMNIRRLHQIMSSRIINPQLARQAKGALDIAAYDVAGKALGVPVSTLLGGAFRDRIWICDSSEGVGSPEEAAKYAEQAVKKGFTHLKMKGSHDPWGDVKRIAAIRTAVGNDVQLRIDPNEAYETAAQAIPPLKAMEKYNLTLAEGILPRHDYRGIAQVCEALDTPVVVHQGLESPQDAANLIHAGAGDVFNIAIQIVGGLYNAMEILATAESFNIPVMVGSTRDLAIADAAGIHFASIIRKLPYACDCRFHLRYADDIVKTPLRIDGGHIFVPQGPGLGIEVDEEKLNKYRVNV